MRLKISHTTRYSFDGPVLYGLQQLRKTPRSGRTQTVLDWTTQVQGGLTECQFTDQHRNDVTLISFDRDTDALIVTTTGTVDMTDTHGVVGPHRGPAPLWLYRQPTPATKPGHGIRGIVRDVTGDTTLDRLHALSGIIRTRVAYELGASQLSWDVETILQEAKGVCQDHTHVFVSCAREMGIPARYVSGYLMLNERTEQDAMHAWAEAYVDQLGWVGFDVSNGYSPDTRYVRVAVGRDYAEAAPVTGTRIGGPGEAMSVEIAVAQQQ